MFPVTEAEVMFPEAKVKNSNTVALTIVETV